MAAVICSEKGCKSWAKDNGRCAAHSKKYMKKLVGEEGSKQPLMVEKVAKVLKNDKDNYYGGTAKQPHVHVYPGGAHLKLGAKRFNLVQNGVKYASTITAAYGAMDEHPLGDDLRPWVDAVLKYF